MPALSVVKNYADGTILTQAQLNAAFDSIESWANLTKLDDENIQSGSITTSLIAPDAITTEKINASSVNLSKLATEVINKLVPAGTIHAYGGNVVPSGYFLCDGAAYSRTVFSALFGAVGTNYGSGDGASTFNVPDLRGLFLRGRDAGTLRDNDSSTRIASGLGGAVGDAVGSYQIDATRLANTPMSGSSVTGSNNQSHTHGQSTNNTNSQGFQAPQGSNQSGTNGGGGNTGPDSNGHNHNFTLTMDTGGDAETRPKNVYVNYIIKS